MKTHFAAVLTLLLLMPFLADPAVAASAQDTKSDSDNARVKALEAEIAALRAQLRAESGIRNEDRGRDRRHEGDRHEGDRRERERRMQGHGDHQGHDLSEQLIFAPEQLLNNSSLNLNNSKI